MDDLSKETLTTAPPPPPEVKIRTMRSDLESVAKSGGGLPQFEKVKVSGLSSEEHPPIELPRAESGSNTLLIVVAVVVFVALIVVGWLLYTKFTAAAPVSQPTQNATSSAAQSGLVAVPTANPTTTSTAQ